MKLANYGLDHWLTLPRYVPEEDTRLLLKNCYRQYQQYSKVQTMLKNNLISLLDAVFPEVNRLFNSSPRADGSEKWVDFVSTFWHCRCVSTLSLKSFSARYLKWCRKHGYYFSQEKAFEIHSKAQSCISVMPRNETTKLLVQQAIAQLKATSAALAALKQEMQSLAAALPEYPVVMEMFGVGSTLGPQLMAEIGDVRRFHSKKALVAFAGIDAPPCQSGQMDIHSRSISKRGSAALRRTLFLVMGIYLQSAPLDEPVYQFMDKKRSEGKPYKVYMMASANKFLRIYYASVTAYPSQRQTGSGSPYPPWRSRPQADFYSRCPQYNPKIGTALHQSPFGRAVQRTDGKNLFCSATGNPPSLRVTFLFHHLFENFNEIKNPFCRRLTPGVGVRQGRALLPLQIVPEAPSVLSAGEHTGWNGSP